jgi:hypothetical protein
VEGNASEAAHGLNLELAIPELNLLGEELNRIAQARTAGGGPKQSGGGAGCAAVKQQMEEGKSQEQAEMNVHQANGACFVPLVGKTTVDSLQRHEEAIEMCRKIREQNAAAWKN